MLSNIYIFKIIIYLGNILGKEKVVIVGAGPAGLFSANELVTEAYDVTVVERSSRVGGAGGLIIDGKCNYHPKIGGDLTEFLPENEAWKVVESVHTTFKKYGVEEGPYDPEKLKDLEEKAIKAKINFIPIRQTHIGSDALPFVIQNFKTDLENRGVKFRLDCTAENIKLKDGKVTEVITNAGNLECDYLLLATGRSSESWLKSLCDEYGLEVKFNPIDVGVRVEVRNEIMSEIVNEYKCWDPKFRIYTSKPDDFVRTFCVCPGGFVIKDSYGNGLYGVNGHSLGEGKPPSQNANFAFLVRINLTEPLEDTTEYGKSIVHQANILGGRKPLIQRLGDLKNRRRSNWNRIEKSYVIPTLYKDEKGEFEVTPGDISMALPERVMVDIMEGLEKLDAVIPGVYSDSTLLYAPEVKFYARRIVTNRHLQTTKIPNLFVAGDGAGVSRGIVGAAATGSVAAQGIKAYA
jgi:hypothetical protein